MFDGKSNDIESWQWLALTSVKILTVNFILLACFYFPEAFSRNIKKICSFMLIFQVLFVVNKYNATVRSSYLVKTTFEESSAYSAKDNIIILVLDTFSSGLFKDILKTNPQNIKKCLKGLPGIRKQFPVLLPQWHRCRLFRQAVNIKATRLFPIILLTLKRII